MQKPRMLILDGTWTEFVMTVTRLPEPGDSVLSEGFKYLPGGHGTHTAVAASRLGGDCIVCSRVGNDGNAADLKQYLESEKIDTRFISTERGESTALEVIIHEDLYKERRIFYPGAGGKLRDADVEEAFIAYPDAVIIHSCISQQVADEAVKMATSQKIPVFVTSASYAPEASLARFGSCEIFSPNEAETVAYTGISPTDQEKCMKACIALMQRVRAKYIVLKLGDRGVFVYDGTYYSFISSYDVPQLSGISSEEAFTAALNLEYLRSDGDIKRACEFALIISAIYLTRGGGLRAYPSAEEVRRFIARNDINFEL